ncbi:MAG: hypothetical protein QM493_10680 [Sulfurovum sp.]
MREFIDEKDRYGAIKLWYEARRDDYVAVMVEAKADELFFRKSLKKEITFFPMDGCGNLLEVLEEIEKNNLQGLIAIIDADFRRIDNEELESDNLFITDGHDCEMMSINSPAWDEVFDYHINREKLIKFEKKHKKTFKEYLFELSREIGLLRYLSKKENLDLKFRIFSKDKVIFIDYNKFIDKDNLKLNKDNMIKVVENKSSKQNLFKDRPELKIVLDKLKVNKYDLVEFCNGHDFIHIFSLSLKKVLNNQNISNFDIEKDLTIAYRYDDFKQTELFKSLSTWEKNNIDYLVLK